MIKANTWTSEHDDLVRRLVAEGHDDRMIADVMGLHRGRCSVACVQQRRLFLGMKREHKKPVPRRKAETPIAPARKCVACPRLFHPRAVHHRRGGGITVPRLCPSCSDRARHMG